MPKDIPSQLKEVTFQCKQKVCNWKFERAPERIEDAPDADHHPWRYYATCPVCGEEAPQASWERALLKAWVNATGPKTEEGKAATAKNLEGHPTPEEAKRTRFNAMKHGLTARVATYFPAKPDGYVFCKGCEVDRDWCRAQPCCVKQTQNFMLHHAAFEQKNPDTLRDMHSDLQASVYALIQMLLQSIFQEGVKVGIPFFSVDPETGEPKVGEYVNENGERKILYREIGTNPLIKSLTELLARNNLSLGDLGMTQRVVEQSEGFTGQLDTRAAGSDALEDYAKKQAESMLALESLINRAGQSKARDPVLIEHESQKAVGT